MRDLLQHVLFSADEGAGGAPADDAAGAADDGTAAEGGGWTGPSEEEWSAVVEQNQMFGQLLDEAARQAQLAQGEQPSIDFFADDAQAQLDAYVERKIAERTAPLSQHQVYQEQQEGSARADDILADLEAEKGEFLFKGEKGTLFDSAGRARLEAEALFPEALQQFPRDPARAAEVALEQAYENVRAWEDAVGKAYHERQLNQLGRLGSAPRQPAVAGKSAAQQVTTPEGGNELDLVSHYFGR